MPASDFGTPGQITSVGTPHPVRWSIKEDRRDDKGVTHAALKTIAAFLNTEGGDLLLGVADDGSIVGIERDQLENDDKFMRHLAQVVRNGMGDRAGTCIDPKTQIVQGKTVCVVSCQRSPEPVFLKWKGLETTPDGDFFVRNGPGTVKLPPDSAKEYIRTRFGSSQPGQTRGPEATGSPTARSNNDGRFCPISLKKSKNRA
jgi:predicted HTH transcriptional regulator